MMLVKALFFSSLVLVAQCCNQGKLNTIKQQIPAKIGIISALAGRSASMSSMKIEKLAFKVCDKDEDFGLSWEEVADCEEVVSELVAGGLPSEEDFNSFDLNNDGIMEFREWMKKMKMDSMPAMAEE